MSTKPFPMRIPKRLLQLAEIKSKEERMDKTTALRQWLYAGAEEYALMLLSEGRLTLSQTADLLEMSVYDVQRLAREQGIAIGATANQYKMAWETARRLKRKSGTD